MADAKKKDDRGNPPFSVDLEKFWRIMEWAGFDSQDTIAIYGAVHMASTMSLGDIEALSSKYPAAIRASEDPEEAEPEDSQHHDH